MDRRGFLRAVTSGAAVGAVRASGMDSPFFRTRGVVITPDDLTLHDWPERAHAAGLTTIALHPTPKVVTAFVESPAGQDFLSRCHGLGVQIEYELHAMSELLPRDLFDRDPSLFRMSESGERVREANLCVHSQRALEIAAENAIRIGKRLRPTTSRYFYWGDDGAPWCRCTKCSDLSDSDQALLLANHLAKALRRHDPRAQVAHLAYANTIPPPRNVRPEPGVFLEFAPIHRTYDVPYASQTGSESRDRIDLLDANLEVFPRETAQALEYWLDLSRFSGWKRPAPKLPWNAAAFAADLDAYGSRGVGNLTSFAVFLDSDYVRDHGDPPLDEYGRRMRAWRRSNGRKRM